MTAPDPAQERQRLTQLYAGMTREELEQIAAEPGSLTEVAQQTLQAEISRRGGTLAPIKVADTREEEPPPRDLVMVRRFRDLPEALLAKGALDSAGIECFLADENMVRLDWFISNLLGGAKLLVDRENVEVAIAILDQPVPDNLDIEGVGEYQQPRCPKCNSLNISYEDLDKSYTFMLAFVMRFPVPIHKRAWTCHDCGVSWREEPAENTDVED